MEWKIFIKALIGAWLVVSVSVLNIFALSLAALSAWHGCKGFFVQTDSLSKVCTLCQCHLGRIDLNFKLATLPPKATKITICHSWQSS